MIFAKHGGAGGGQPAEVAAGLVPVAQLVGDRAEHVRQSEHQRLAVAVAQLPGGDRLLQHPARRGRLAGLPVQPRQQVGGGQHLRMIFAQAGLGHLQPLLQHQAGAIEVAVAPQNTSVLLNGGQMCGLRHPVMLPGLRGGRQPGWSALLCTVGTAGVQ
jgi:hypothetical protein